ncbi:MAG: family 20 glycosylhydrolase [Phycisphaerales bacterium]|nr:family 20 glycosylhydrolase [Phycisphaerales bacterium]
MMSTKSEETLLVIPTPTRVERLGEAVRVPVSGGGGVKVRTLNAARSNPNPTREAVLERSTKGQAYRLTVRDPQHDGGVLFEIECQTHAGERHARATITQLLRAYPETMPRVRIEDAPAFAVRGAMLDVSRTRVPTMLEMHDIVASLAALKYNHLQLYTEHTFAYAGHEEAWRGHGAFTPDEIRRLDELCAQHGIELAANQNCFGHLAHWLRMPRYAHLAETHGDWMFDVWPRSGPFSLSPAESGSLDLVDDWLAQLLPCFTSGLVNIGCDETYDVGWGKSKSLVDAAAAEFTAQGMNEEQARGEARARVYLQFVERVCSLVRARGKRPMFWADIALAHPQRVSEIPEDLVALAWGYEPHSEFDRWCELLSAASAGGTKRETWVCPGTSSWRSTIGRTRERDENLANAAAAGLKHGAPGYLVCDWGDTGHHQTWPITLHALSKGAQAAWSTQGVHALDTRAIALHVFGDSTLQLGAWLDELGNADEPLRRVCGRLSRPKQPGEFALWNQSALFADLHNCTLTDRTEVGDIELWRDAAGRIEDAWVGMVGRLNGLIDDELEHTIAVARFALRRAIARREGHGTLNPRTKTDLIAMGKAIADEHKRLWLARSRPGGLEISLGHYRRIITELEQA